MRALVLIALVACGSTPAPRPLVVYRNAADAFELRLSANGHLAAMVAFLDAGKYEIRLWQRGTDEHMVGRGPGTIVGVPNESDVLVIDNDNEVRWLRDGQKAKLALPAGARWRFVGGTVDHDAHAATLAFATIGNLPGLVVLELDTATLGVRKHLIVRAAEPDTCGARGRGRTLYVWCLDPSHAPKDGEAWSVTRFDGIRTMWSTFVDMPLMSGSDMRGEVTGDGSALVLLFGLRETSRTRFSAGRMFVFDAGQGRMRELTESFGFVDDLTPVPGRPAVAYVRWIYNDFDGIVVLDAGAMTMRVPVGRDDKLAPLAMAVLPDGQFLVPGH